MSEKDEKNVVPKKNSFELSKVKFLKGGGLDVHYNVTEVIDDESYTNKYHVESAKDVHPDLIELFVRIKPILARVFNITSFLTCISTDDFKANKMQKEIAEDFAKEMMNNIEVRGISLSGKDDNVGVIITGLFTTYNNQKTCINSPRIKLSVESFGFEEELEEIVTEIEEEVYDFLFKGKKAQLELFGQNVNIDDEVEIPEL
jgi:hypothetical protein